MGHTKLYCPKKTEKTAKTEKIGKKRNLPFTLLEQASNYQKTI